MTTDHSSVTIAIAPGAPTNGGPGTLSTCTSTGESKGVFSFSSCTINTAGGGYQLLATDGQQMSATSAPFSVMAGPPTHILFSTEPSNAIGGSAFVNQPVITIQDAGNNTVTADTQAIALTIQSGPGALSGCSATTMAGVATFSGCSITTAGTYTLAATNAGDNLNTTSSSFAVGTGVPNQLAFTTEPGSATGGTAFAAQPVVTIEDPGGNTVTTATSTVTLAIGSGPGTLSGCAATTTAGVASFSGCSINTAGSHTLMATDASLTAATSNPFNVAVGTGTHLAVTTSPAGATGGTAFVTQPVVAVEDAGNNIVTANTSTVTLSITAATPTTGGPGTLTCTPTAATNGVAAFTGCSIDTAGTGYELHAVDGSLGFANSSAFNVAVGTGTHLAVTTSPAGATGGTAFVTQPVVAIKDAGGNTVTTDTSTVALAITAATPATGGPGTLTCTPTAATNGVAAFTGCSIDTAGTAYQLTATDDALTPADSAAFDVTVGPASQLAVTTEPSDASAGSAIAPSPAVTVEDAGGNTVTADTSTVALAITGDTPATGGPGTLTCAPAAAVNGVATFDGCSIDTVGTGYQLTASDDVLTPAGTTAFDISAGAAAQLAVTTSPAGATGGTAFSTQPTVTVQDAEGNTVTTDTSTVALAITAATPATGGPGTLTCTPTAATNGVAAFTGCSIDTAGTAYQLTATDDALTPADSAAFDVTVGPASQLVFTTQPGDAAAGTAFGTQPVVTVEDAGGNTVTTDTSTVNMVIGSGTGNISGCSETTTAGVVSFSGCSIDTAGNFTLDANDATEPANNLSDPFTVTS